MAEPLVSIVIPVYNTEEYLGRAVDSVLRQTVPDWELILVDDGSTDNSAALCDEYARRDGRIRVIHQPNGGVSAARNAGMDAAAGEYLHFVDSDDEIAPGMLAELLPLMEDGEVGLAMGGFCFCEPDHVAREYHERGVFSKQEIDFFGGEFCVHSGGKLYRKAIVREHGVRFPTEFACSEDVLFLFEYLVFIARIACTEAPLYRMHRDDPGRPHTALYFFPDQFELLPKMADSMYRAAEHGKHDKTLQRIYDKAILYAVRAYAYRDFFAPGELWPRLRAVLRQPVIRRAAKVYRRTRAQDSRIIPFLLRLRCPLAAVFLRARGKRYLRERGRRPNLKSVYRAK